MVIIKKLGFASRSLQLNNYFKYEKYVCSFPTIIFHKRSYCNDKSNGTNGSSNAKHYDIVISGGGMVGFSMACALGKLIFFIIILKI